MGGSFSSFAQGLTGSVDILPAVERLRVVVAAVASFLVGSPVRVRWRPPDSSLTSFLVNQPKQAIVALGYEYHRSVHCHLAL